MKNYNTLSNRTTRRNLLSACATALAMASMVSLSQPAHAGQIIVPRVPDNIKVKDGSTAFLVGHADGTQNYICLPCSGLTCPTSGVSYALFTPEATLFNDDEKQLITHYFSPNPFEKNTNPALVAEGPIRATWQHRDTSTVWAKVNLNDDGSIGSASHESDPAFVDEGAVAWLLLKVVGAEDGPTGGDTLSNNPTFIQRLNTHGGVAPAEGCSSPTDVGHQAFMPYTADYFFYRKAE